MHPKRDQTWKKDMCLECSSNPFSPKVGVHVSPFILLPSGLTRTPVFSLPTRSIPTSPYPALFIDCLHIFHRTDILSFSDSMISRYSYACKSCSFLFCVIPGASIPMRFGIFLSVVRYFLYVNAQVISFVLGNENSIIVNRDGRERQNCHEKSWVLSAWMKCAFHLLIDRRKNISSRRYRRRNVQRMEIVMNN